MIWQYNDINCKWAPYLLYGPSVSVENALEFIRRTDRCLIEPKFRSNSRVFENKLNSLIGMPDDWKISWTFQEAYAEDFGSIELAHLASNWVASSWIFGPSGPVHPNGNVYKVANFGKYPSVEEIEADLEKLSEFPWLSFKLYVWDNYDEKAEGEPDFGWAFTDGKWSRTSDLPAETRREQDLRKALSSITFMPTESRECTWTVETIKEMWGDKIAKARAAGEQAIKDAQSLGGAA